MDLLFNFELEGTTDLKFLTDERKVAGNLALTTISS